MTRDAPAPPVIPDYELLREIGRGSYGTVWIARSVTGLFRAVKIVWRGSFPDPVPYEREFRGLKEFAAVSLTEPRLLALLHVGRNDAAGFFYYVMELADDIETGSEIDPERYVPKTLREVRKRCGRLPASETLTLGVDLANALAGLHDHHLVHRDIKPSNIIFVSKTPKLADVGLVTSAASMDESRSRVGNLGYMPPDCPGSPSADVYGLGKVLYELVTGRDHTDYPRLPPNLETFPDRKELLELNEVFIRACATDGAKRYPDAKALLEELRLLHAGKSVRRLRAAERNLTRAIRSAAILAIVAFIAGAGAFLEHKRAARAEAERDLLRRRAEYTAALMEADGALATGDYARARLSLRTLVPAPSNSDLRGIEWRALWRQAHGAPSEVLRDAPPGIERLAMTADGAWLVVHDEAKTVSLHDLESTRETRHFSGIHRLAGLSHDGKWLVGSNEEFALQRWRLSDGLPNGASRGGRVHRPLAIIEPHAVLAFVDEDVSRNAPPALLVWDFEQQRVTKNLTLERGWGFLRASVDSVTGRVLLACVRDPLGRVSFKLIVANVLTGEVLRAPSPLEPTAVGWLRTGATMRAWVANGAGAFSMWDEKDNTWRACVEKLPAQTSFIASFGYDGDTRLIVHDNKISLAEGPYWTLRDGFQGHGGRITSVVFQPGGHHLFSATNGGEIRKWDYRRVGSSRNHYVGWNPGGAINRIAFSPDGSKLYVAKDGIRVAILDRATMGEVGVIPNMRFALTTTSEGVWGLSANGRSVICYKDQSQDYSEWNGVENQELVHAAIAANGRRLCLVSSIGDLCSIDLSGKIAPVAIISSGRKIWSLRMNQTGTSACFYREDRRLVCVDLESGQERWASALGEVAADVEYLSGEDTVLVLLANGSFQVHDATTGRLRTSGFCGSGNPQGFALTPDKSRVLIADRSGNIHVIATAGWVYLGRIRTGLTDSLRSITIAPDEQAVAAVTPSGIVYTVDARPF